MIERLARTMIVLSLLTVGFSMVCESSVFAQATDTTQVATSPATQRSDESAETSAPTPLYKNPYVIIVLLTLIPLLELRFSIPYGILVFKMHWLPVAATAVIANILLGPIVFFLLDKFLHLVLKIKILNAFWERTVVKIQKKVHPKVERYGVLGLGLFIGVPLPGSGVYSGAAGGYLLGFTKLEFYIATVVGVLLAAAAVTGVVFVGEETLGPLYHWLVKPV